jgi:hypothetical protein
MAAKWRNRRRNESENIRRKSMVISHRKPYQCEAMKAVSM